MVETPDGDSVDAWLKTQSREVCVAVAMRSALRATAILGVATRTAYMAALALAAFRGVLAAGVASVLSDAKVREAAALAAARSVRFGHIGGYSVAAEAAFEAVAAVDVGAAAAARAARAAAEAALYAGHELEERRNADSFVAEAAAAQAERSVYAAFSSDATGVEAGETPEQRYRQPVWLDVEEPMALTEARSRLVAFLETDPQVWGFWARWYQGMFDGRPMDWELQRKVALIPEPFWQEGPASVAAEIARIEAEFLALALPQAERAEIDEATGRILFVPIPVENPRLLGAVLGQVADALDDALANPSNGLTERSRETRVLRRTVQRYGNDPQRIEMDFVSVHAGLTRQIIVEDLPASEENLALQRALEEGAQAVRATHPDVAENRATLSRQAIAEMPPEAVAAIVAAGPDLAEITVPELGQEMAEDAAEIAERHSTAMAMRRTLGPAVRNPGLAAYDAEVRYFSRVAKIAILLRKTPEIVHRIDQSAGYKAARILATVTTLVREGLRFLSWIL